MHMLYRRRVDSNQNGCVRQLADKVGNSAAAFNAGAFGKLFWSASGQAASVTIQFRPECLA
jgi:hypothetical protein